MENLGIVAINHQDRHESVFHVLTLTMTLWLTSGKGVVPAFQWLSGVAY